MNADLAGIYLAAGRAAWPAEESIADLKARVRV